MQDYLISFIRVQLRGLLSQNRAKHDNYDVNGKVRVINLLTRSASYYLCCIHCEVYAVQDSLVEYPKLHHGDSFRSYGTLPYATGL